MKTFEKEKSPILNIVIILKVLLARTIRESLLISCVRRINFFENIIENSQKKKKSTDQVGVRTLI